jgi:hypothetical protein
MSGPYEFGDVVDGYRWTVLGWEPVEGSEPAASAALQHALDTRLARPAVTHHARHTSAATRPVAPATPAPDADTATQVEAAATTAATDVDPEPAAEPDLPAAGAVVADPAPALAGTAAPEPERRWTPVGWELVEPEVDDAPERALGADDLEPQDEGGRPAGVGDPIEEFADVLAAAPSAPPIEPDAELGHLVDVTTIDLAGVEDGSRTQPDAEDVEVLDLREPVAARPVTLVEPPAGWYPG